MSLIGLVNLAEKLFNQTQGNLNEDGGGTNRPVKTVAQSSLRNQADEFRPSAGNAANEAGLFQVTQQQVFTAAATTILVVPEHGGANGTGSGNTATTAPTLTAKTAGGATANLASTATTHTTDSTQILAQLQSLNSALASLGLSQDEIAAVDRVAQLIKDFNAAAFTSLINQLQVLAQDSAQPAANAPAANAGATNGTGVGQNNGFSIQELSIKFAGVNETVQQGGKTLQISAFQLQVSEVNLTLNNATTGQTAQIQAPQAATSATTGTAPLAKAATA